MIVEKQTFYPSKNLKVMLNTVTERLNCIKYIMINREKLKNIDWKNMAEIWNIQHLLIVPVGIEFNIVTLIY